MKRFITITVFLVLVSISFFGCELGSSNSGNDGNQSPNIVLIYMDDLGYGELGAYGATEIQTPNMDALAASGICFINGYATFETCSPSMYALMTGSYPWRNENAKKITGNGTLTYYHRTSYTA